MNSGIRSAVRVRSGYGHPPWPDITTKKKRRRAPPKMCEGCGLKQPGFGLLLDGKKRWCGRCAQAEGAVLLQKRNVCEGCDCVKTANFGLQSEGKRRWCGACGKAKGRYYLGARRCAKVADFGMPTLGGQPKANGGGVEPALRECLGRLTCRTYALSVLDFSRRRKYICCKLISCWASF